MEILLATSLDIDNIIVYDSHIHPLKVNECIDRGLIYVLKEDEKVFGILRYNLFWQSVPFVDLLYIDEAYRGIGYGRRMMNDWERQMQQMGYSYVMLSTQENETSKYFYERIGYERIGLFLPPEQEANEIIYCKRLSA